MSSVRIIGHPMSTCTRRVMYAAALLKVPIEMVTIDWSTGQHKSPEHMKKQPFGKVPVLEHDGFTLFESRAICRYINDVVSSSHSLIPSDPKQRALFEQWAAVELGTLNPDIDTIVSNQVFAAMKGASPDVEAVKKAHEHIKTSLAVLDKQLSTHKYIAGDHISLVDIWILPNLWAIYTASPSDGKQLIDANPHIAAWWKRITETPEWKAIVAK